MMIRATMKVASDLGHTATGLTRITIMNVLFIVVICELDY